MNQQQEAAAPRGIYDEKPKAQNTEITDENLAPNRQKQDFKDPFSEHAEKVTELSDKQKPKLDEIIEKSTLEKTADAVNSGGEVKSVQADLDGMNSISPEDLELAEQMVFRGYAEFDVEMKNLPGHKFTMCSTSAEEMGIIDEIVFDILKKAEDDSGNVQLPQTKVQGIRNGLFIAISYRGMDRKEIMQDSNCHLNSIKKAIIQVSELEGVGELEKAEKLKISLKEKLMKRGVVVNRLATPVIDFLSNEKYEFDAKMSRIMNTKELLPKS